MNETIIYQNTGPQAGEAWVSTQPTPSSLVGLLGRILIITGLVGLFIFFGPSLFLETKWRLSQLSPQEAKKTEPSGFAKIIQISDLQILQPTDAQFSIVIPKINVNSPVVANVSAGDESEYETALKKGVAHAAGSHLPGENGTIYLFGHSTDYIWNVSRFDAIFYLLKELESGDEVNLFYRGHRHLYHVTDKQTVSAKETNLLKSSSGQEVLILQTCWPPGTAWKRLIVTATPDGKT